MHQCRSPLKLQFIDRRLRHSKRTKEVQIGISPRPTRTTGRRSAPSCVSWSEPRREPPSTCIGKLPLPYQGLPPAAVLRPNRALRDARSSFSSPSPSYFVLLRTTVLNISVTNVTKPMKRLLRISLANASGIFRGQVFLFQLFPDNPYRLRRRVRRAIYVPLSSHAFAGPIFSPRRCATSTRTVAGGISIVTESWSPDQGGEDEDHSSSPIR